MRNYLLQALMATALLGAAVCVSATEYHLQVPVKGLKPSAPAVAAGLVSISGVTRWADGTFANSCSDYLNAVGGHAYTGATGDGIYAVQYQGAQVPVYCDMTNNGGGWTLLAHPRYNAGLGVYGFTQLNPVTPSSNYGVQSSLWAPTSTYAFQAIRFTDSAASATTWAVANLPSSTSLAGLSTTYPNYRQTALSTSVTASPNRSAVKTFWFRGMSAAVAPWNDGADWLYMGFSSAGSPNGNGDIWDTQGANWVLGATDNTYDPMTGSYTKFGWLAGTGQHWAANMGLGDNNLLVWVR